MKSIVIIIGLLIIMGFLTVYVANKIEDLMVKYKNKRKQK